MKRKKGHIKNKIPKIKKEIKDFLLEDEGKISKKSVVTMGITLAVLAMTVNPHPAYAGHTNTVTPTHNDAYDMHSSGFDPTSHTSNKDHSNYMYNVHASHGSHCNCAWN